MESPDEFRVGWAAPCERISVFLHKALWRFRLCPSHPHALLCYRHTLRLQMIPPPVLPLRLTQRGRWAVRQTLLKLGKTVIIDRRGSLVKGSIAGEFQLSWICLLHWSPQWKLWFHPRCIVFPLKAPLANWGITVSLLNESVHEYKCCIRFPAAFLLLALLQPAHGLPLKRWSFQPRNDIWRYDFSIYGWNQWDIRFSGCRPGSWLPLF